MKITYDKKVDALNLTLKTGKVARTLEVSPEIFLDVDKNGDPLFLEIVGVSEKIGKENFSTVSIGRKSFPVSALV
jgi:uncharacterized protein YuzE